MSLMQDTCSPSQKLIFLFHVFSDCYRTTETQCIQRFSIKEGAANHISKTKRAINFEHQI